MPLRLPLIDPYTTQTNPDGFAWAAVVAFDNLNQSIRLVYRLHPSAGAAFTGGQPYPEPVEVVIGPVARDAEHGPAPLLDPGSAAVYSEPVPPTYQLDPNGQPVLDSDGNPVVLDPGKPAVLVTPAVPPTYGPAPVLRPRVPSYNEVVAAHPALFSALADAVDAVVVAVAPEFRDAAVIPRAS